tara:strand:- start:2940 stop:3242 length:303 start_codon:yes stop_codon:yes gene_type:complete
MPFSCHFQLNNGAISDEDEIIFQTFIDSSFGTFHAECVRIATVSRNGQRAFISTTCPCFPSSKNKELTEGTRIVSSTVIGAFSANGEDIPYNKPYAKIVF